MKVLGYREAPVALGPSQAVKRESIGNNVGVWGPREQEV